MKTTILPLILAASLTGCAISPAVIGSHDSRPSRGYPVNDKFDTSTEFVGGGGCFTKEHEHGSTDSCLFGGARRETFGTTQTTAFGVQGFVLRKFDPRGER